MQIPGRTGSFLRAAVVVALLAWRIPSASAEPYTPYFDNLIAELQLRAGALSNSTDKVEQGQYKAIVKVLKTLLDKDSASLATDIKNAGKIAKTLAKAFPNEFNPPMEARSLTGVIVTLPDLFESLFGQFEGDATAFVAAVQGAIDGLEDTQCKTAAQAVLDSAQAQLAELEAAPDFATLAKLLGKALKTIIKANGSAEKALGCTNSGGGGGGGGGCSGNSLKATVDGNGFQGITAVATYLPITGQLTITGVTANEAVTVIVFDPVVGSNPAGGGSQYQQVGGSTYAGNLTGTVVFTQLSLAGAGSARGTFSFSVSESMPAPNASNVVNVTQGCFSVTSITQLGF